ncbi:hypothetical protein KCP74_14175 [Salmonella enterica subsp. enterica]|nr:hypothetical protein KCP74_14175 [Salmonella enterica subsp. enterica]
MVVSDFQPGEDPLSAHGQHPTSVLSQSLNFAGWKRYIQQNGDVYGDIWGGGSDRAGFSSAFVRIARVSTSPWLVCTRT